MSKRIVYINQLDSLRAIAAIMVLCAHYVEDLNIFHFPYGGYGVQIFFVISGFLITSILLSQKNILDIPKRKLVFNFIIKRALRLFPIYYLFVFFLFGLSITGGLWICREGGFWYYLTYTQNYFFYLYDFQSPLLNHSWSLAVEEQFYIIWPFFILFLPRKMELFFIISITLIGVFANFYFSNYYSGMGTTKGVTFSHFFTLGTGALLAYIKTYQCNYIVDFFKKHCQWMLVVVFLLSVFFSVTKFDSSFFSPFPIALMSAFLVFICSYSVNTFLTPVLNLKLLQDIGKISYGVYLYHKPIPFFFNFIYAKLSLPIISNKIILFCIYFMLTIIIAKLSMKLIEKPIFKIKEKFDL